MKRSLYNMALAICTAAAMYSCSLDEYNPSDTSGEGELKTVEGLKNLGTYCILHFMTKCFLLPIIWL